MKKRNEKIRVNISMDKKVHETLKHHNFKVSTLIDSLLKKHLSQFPNRYSHKVTRRSVVQIHSSLLLRGLVIGDSRSNKY